MNQEELQQKVQIQQQVLQIENFAKQFLTNEAIQRYGNIKAAHQEKALQITLLISQLAQQKKIQNKLTDEQFKDLLLKIDQPKRDVKIMRK